MTIRVFTPPATGGEPDLVSMHQALTLGTWHLQGPHAPTDPGLFLLAPRRLLGEVILLCRAGIAPFRVRMPEALLRPYTRRSFLILSFSRRASDGRLGPLGFLLDILIAWLLPVSDIA